ncbi:MAG: sugar phosphate nucleotidyltransferase [Candidatus Eisenbacteria bacterium]|nr:sugar phosphate nucleotidyltransferase [Candidatus Eisenbacteria bacterium]
MKALILAGGEGRRLRAVLGKVPKCLAEVRGRPFIEHQIELLKSEGVREFVLCVGPGGNLIQRTLGGGGRLGVSIEYSREGKPLGTAGAIKNASSFIDGRFLCVNGDTLVEFSLKDMESGHAGAGAIGTILFKTADAAARGTIEVGAGGQVLGFAEKTERGGPAFINCGFYLMEREILDHIPGGQGVSLEEEIFPKLLRSGLSLFAFPARGAFIDIGTPESYSLMREKGWKQ